MESYFFQNKRQIIFIATQNLFGIRSPSCEAAVFTNYTTSVTPGYFRGAASAVSTFVRMPAPGRGIFGTSGADAFQNSDNRLFGNNPGSSNMSANVSSGGGLFGT